MRIQFVSEDKVSDPQINKGKLFYNSTTDNLYLCTGDAFNRFIMNRSGFVGININRATYALEIISTNSNAFKLSRGTNIFSITMSDSTESGRTIISGDLQLNTPMKYDSGGTGFSNYQNDDLLIGDSSTGLKKLNKSANIGSMLISGENGLEYNTHILKNFISIGDPKYVSNVEMIIPNIYCRNRNDSNFITMENINLSLDNNLQGGQVGGLISPDPDNIILTDSINGFNPVLEYKIGDSITIENQTKKIINNNPLTVSSIFTILPLWSLSGTANLSTTQFRFGTKSFNSTATTAFSTILTRQNTPAEYTIEFFFRLNSTGATLNLLTSNTANTFLIAFARNPMNITISLGQGTTYNIANAVRLSTTALVINVWYHLSVVRTSNRYRFFIDGIEQNSITSTLNILSASFNSFRLGGNALTYNGFIDEFRISNIARYTANYTAPTSAFILDNSTISLNHFDSTTITKSDDCCYKLLNHFRNTNYTENQVLYTYAQKNKIFITPRETEEDVADLDIDISSNDIRKIPIYHIVNSTNVPYSVLKTDSYFDIHPNILIINAVTNTSASTSNLSNFIPLDARRIRILIQHTHVGTISAGVTVGTVDSLYNTYLIMNTAGTQYLTIDIPIIDRILYSFLTVLASTTNFSITLLGFYC